MTTQKESPTYKEIEFNPATLNGLGVELKSEKGLFYIFSITADLSEIEYYYSKTGTDEDLVEPCEIDIDFGAGFYENTKKDLIETLKDLRLDKRASELFDAWYASLKNN